MQALERFARKAGDHIKAVTESPLLPKSLALPSPPPTSIIRIHSFFSLPLLLLLLTKLLDHHKRVVPELSLPPPPQHRRSREVHHPPDRLGELGGEEADGDGGESGIVAESGGVGREEGVLGGVVGDGVWEEKGCLLGVGRWRGREEREKGGNELCWS